MAASSPTAASSAPLQRAPHCARLMSRNVLFLVKRAQGAQRSCGRGWTGHVGNKTAASPNLCAYLVLIQPLAGTWLGQRDHSLVIVAGTLLLGAGFATTSLASSLLGYGGAAVIWTLGEIAMAAAGSTVAANLARARLRGRYLGLYGAVCSLGGLLAPLGGAQLLRAGAPALWLTCGAVAGAAALGQLTLAPAVRHRTGLTPGKRPAS